MSAQTLATYSVGSNYVLRKQHENPKEVNSSLSYFCQLGEPSNVKLRGITLLIHHIIREPCFSTLRTKEQLGYAAPLFPVHFWF